MVANRDSDSDSTQSKRTQKEKKYKCTYQGCDKKFFRKDRFEGHLRSHSNVRPFKCDHANCDKAFFLKAKLANHKLSAHNENKDKVHCPFEGCLQVMQKNNLSKHMIRKHSTREHKFKCEVCGKVCRRKTDLENHKNLHNPIYKCTFCGQILATNSQYNSHIKTHKALKCSCLLTFYSNTELRNHQAGCSTFIKTQSQSKLCNICDKYFSSRSNLKQHVRTVHQDNTFQCHFNNCNKQYKLERSLKQHVKECHTGESKVELTPKTCEICKENFKSKYSLAKHMSNIHKEGLEKTIKPARRRNDKGVPTNPMITCLTGIRLPKEDRVKLKRTEEPDESRDESGESDTDEENASLSCDKCEATFSHTKALLYHMKYVHRKRSFTDMKSCSYEGCTLKFVNEKKFKEHERICHLPSNSENFHSKGVLEEHEKEDLTRMDE